MSAFLFVVAEIYVCKHDQFIEERLRSEEPRPLFPKPHFKSQDVTAEIDPRPIRIYLDFKNVDAPSPALGVTYGEAEKEVIKVTLKNLQIFLQSTINISRSWNGAFSSSYSISNDQTVITNPSILSSDCDLYVFVNAKDMGETSNTLAQASPLQREFGGRGRPVAGFISINVRKIPKQAQNISSGNRQFFMTVAHEVNHIMSFSGSIFKDWEYGSDPKSEKSLSKITNFYNMEQTFIRSPNLINYVNDLFDLSSPDTVGCGLELERWGGGGTAGSHPNERLYFTDFMQGVLFGPAYFSPVYYNTLLDTGWYLPNPENFEQTAYLNRHLGNYQMNETIVKGPPVYTFPKSYRCFSDTDMGCFIDHVFKGSCSLSDPTQPVAFPAPEGYNSRQNYESNISWFNPTRSPMIGSSIFHDYYPMLLPNTNCKGTVPTEDGKAETHLEVYGADSMCLRSTITTDTLELITNPIPACMRVSCGTDQRVRIMLQGKYHLCQRDGQKLRVNGVKGYVVCPNALVACAAQVKEKRVNVVSALPDRGPKDGGNLVGLQGFGLEKYNKENLKILIGEHHVPCNIEMVMNNTILCKMENPEKYCKSVKSLMAVPQIGYLNYTNKDHPEENLFTVVEDLYTFIKYDYNS